MLTIESAVDVQIFIWGGQLTLVENWAPAVIVHKLALGGVDAFLVSLHVQGFVDGVAAGLDVRVVLVVGHRDEGAAGEAAAEGASAHRAVEAVEGLLVGVGKQVWERGQQPDDVLPLRVEAPSVVVGLLDKQGVLGGLNHVARTVAEKVIFWQHGDVGRPKGRVAQHVLAPEVEREDVVLVVVVLGFVEELGVRLVEEGELGVGEALFDRDDGFEGHKQVGLSVLDGLVHLGAHQAVLEELWVSEFGVHDADFGAPGVELLAFGPDLLLDLRRVPVVR